MEKFPVLTLKEFPVFRGEVISILERFLHDNDIKIENNDPEKLNTENAAIIYGEDFDRIENEIRFGLRDYFKTNNFTVDVDNVINSFVKIVNERGSAAISSIDIESIEQQIKDVYTSWGLKVD